MMLPADPQARAEILSLRERVRDLPSCLAWPADLVYRRRSIEPTPDCMGWPAHFPENCPPADAAEPVGVFFRLLLGQVASLDDLASHFELGKRFRFHRLCIACGLSCLPSREEIEEVKQRYPGMAAMTIARIDLTGLPGRLKATPSGSQPGHHTWWLPSEADRSVLLSRLVPVAENMSASHGE
jgi:hypothetical protein